MPDFWQGVEFSHMLLGEHISEGATVIDATAGNGYDTVFLADLVGIGGRVFSFDIQKTAVNNTRDRLLKNNLLARVELIEDSHENFGKYINKDIDGMVFNLGYLPGGNKEITTKKESTVKAVKKGIKHLKIGGIIVFVIYTGHPGGEEELGAILDLTANLTYTKYNILSYSFINQLSSPQVLAIIRRK